jgi:hypothetical protein
MDPISRRPIAIVLVAIIALTLSVPFPQALMASERTAPIITSVAIGPARGPSNTLVTLGYIEQDNYIEQENFIEQENIFVRSINRRTGLREGGDLVISLPEGRTGVTPVQLLFSRLIRPGSLLVLDSSLQVHEYPIGFGDDGTPFTAGGVTVHGPFGDPTLLGEATAFAEAPGGAAGAATLALGTKLGQIIAVLIGVRSQAQLTVSQGPIDDLGVIPQVGHFAFLAATNGRLIGINADADARTPGPQPEATFDLASSPGGMAILDIGTQIQDGTSNTLTAPAPVRVVAANGTSNIFLFEIPSSPGSRDSLTLLGIERLGPNIRQVGVGSLVALSTDGGVHYQPSFTLERGFRGPTFTVAGASMSLEPEALNLRSRGRHVTAFIKVANGSLAEIDTASLSFQVEGVAGSLFPAEGFRPRCEDDQSHGSVLVVKIERNDLYRLLAGVSGDTATVQSSWTAFDGAGGSASTPIHIVR